MIDQSAPDQQPRMQLLHDQAMRNLFYAQDRLAIAGNEYSEWIRDLTREGVEPNPGPHSVAEVEAILALSRLTRHDRYTLHAEIAIWSKLLVTINTAISQLEAQMHRHYMTIVGNIDGVGPGSTAHVSRATNALNGLTIQHNVHVTSRAFVFATISRTEQELIGLLGAGSSKGDGPEVAVVTLVEDGQAVKKRCVEWVPVDYSAFDAQMHWLPARAIWSHVHSTWSATPWTWQPLGLDYAPAPAPREMDQVDEMEVAPPLQYFAGWYFMNKQAKSAPKPQAKPASKPVRDATAQLFVRLAAVEKQQKKALQPAVIARAAKQALPKSAARAVAQGTVKAAKSVEWRTEHEGVPVLTSEGKTMHHGHAETRMMGEVLCVKGTERLGPLGVLASTVILAGDTMQLVELNPASFGVRLPLLALPYAQFEFTKVVARYVGLISEANALANGGLYMGYNKDPDSAVPQGNNGLDAISTWGKNVVLCPIFNQSKELHVQLESRENSEPLFVDSSDDRRFSSQGQLLVLAGQEFNGGMEDQNFGQWFIEYEVKLFEINQPSALSNCITGLGQNIASGATGASVISPGSSVGAANLISNWIGDTSLVTAVATAIYGGNLMLNRTGVYLINIWATIAGSGNGFSAQGSVLPITGCFVGDAANDSVAGGSFLDGNSNFGAWNIVNNTAGGGDGDVVLPDGTLSPLTGSNLGIVNSYTIQSDAGGIINVGVPANTNGTLNHIVMIEIMRITNNIRDDFVYRGSPQQVGKDGKDILTANQNRLLTNARRAPIINIDDKTKIEMMKLWNVYKNGDAETHYLNILNKCFELGMPILCEPPTTMHPAMSVILFLVKSLGPLVAAKMLGVAEKKLEGWIHGKKEQVAAKLAFCDATSQFESTQVLSQAQRVAVRSRAEAHFDALSEVRGRQPAP
jgi:hypothetical protein